MAFDAVETVREVLGILEQQYVVVTLLRDVLDRGLQVAIGTETGVEPLAECSLVVAPYEIEGEQAGTIGVLGPTRMNYPQALAAVAVVSKRLEPSPHRGLSRASMPADYYELLGVAPRRDPGRDQAGLPPAGPRAAPRRQPRRSRRPRRGSRRSRVPTRRCPTPNVAGATTCSARKARPAARRRRSVRVRRRHRRHLRRVLRRRRGGFGRGGRRRRAAARRRPRGRRRPRVREGGVRRRAGHHRAHRGRVRDVPGHRRRPGTSPVDVSRVRRRRPGPPGAPVDPRPDGHGRAVRPVRRARPDHRAARAPTAAARAGAIEDKTYTVDVPAGVDTGSTLRLSGRGAAGVRGGGFGDLYVHVRVGPSDRGSSATATTSCTSCTSRSPRRCSAPHLPFETLDGEEDLVIPRGTQSGRVFRLRNRGVPHVEGRGRGDLLVQVVVDTPTELSPRGGGAAAPARRAAGRGGRAGRHRASCRRIRSAFK